MPVRERNRIRGLKQVNAFLIHRGDKFITGTERGLRV
jgi:hypothetical protein